MDQTVVFQDVSRGSRTCRLRTMFRDLSRSVCLLCISRSSAHPTCFQPFCQASWPIYERTSTAYFHDHHGAPFLRPSAAGAMAARETSALLLASRRDPLIPPPLPAYTAATPWPNRYHWWESARRASGVRKRAARQSCDRPGTGPVGDASRPRSDVCCQPAGRGMRHGCSRWALHAGHELGDFGHITDLLQGTDGVDEGGRLPRAEHRGREAPEFVAHLLPGKRILR
jgi:hypothetical protein